MKNLKAETKKLTYPVQKVNLEEMLPGIKFNPQKRYGIQVETPSGPTIVHTCSKDYTLVHNEAIIDGIKEALDGLDYTLTSNQVLNSRFNMDIIINDLAVEVNKKDKVNAKIKITNSYDGRVKYSFNMGFYRMICSNGLVLPLEGFTDKNIRIKMRHTPKVEDSTSKVAIIDMVSTFKESIKDLILPYKELSAQKITNPEERIKEVLDNTKFSPRVIQQVIEREVEERKLLGHKESNDWLIYNAFNYQLNHNEDIKSDVFKKNKIDEQVMKFLIHV